MHIIAERFVAPVLAEGVPIEPSRPHRTPIERLLWGSATEYCDECGTALRARDAVRYPGGRVYCSVAHAIADQES